MNRQVILIAEDDENDAILLRRELSALGIGPSLRFVRDGEQAISYLSGEGEFEDRTRHPLPSLILLDIKMPKLTGFDVLAWIRNSRNFNLTVTVVFSSSNEPADVTRSYELRANSFVMKPACGDLKPFAELFYNYWMKINICRGNGQPNLTGLPN